MYIYIYILYISHAVQYVYICIYMYTYNFGSPTNDVYSLDGDRKNCAKTVLRSPYFFSGMFAGSTMVKTTYGYVCYGVLNMWLKQHMVDVDCCIDCMVVLKPLGFFVLLHLNFCLLGDLRFGEWVHRLFAALFNGFIGFGT